MKNFIFAIIVVFATVQVIPRTDAFIIKTVSIQKGYGAPVTTLPSAEASSAAFVASKNALIQTVSNAVTQKINTLTSLVTSLVQLKARAKQDLWRTTVNAGSGVINSVNGIVAAKPTVFTKTISFGFQPLFTSTILPVTTTAVSGGVATTTTGQSSGYYRRRY